MFNISFDALIGIFLTSFIILLIQYFWMKRIIERSGYDPKWFKNQDWSVFSKFYNLIKKSENVYLKIKFGFILISYFIILLVGLFCFFLLAVK